MAGAPVLFIDRGLGRRILADALRSNGEHVEVHDDHFDQSAKDVDWLPVISKKGWIVLTKDEALARNAPERLAIKQSNARIFLLAHGSASGPVMVEAFTKALASMKAFAESHDGPFIAKVYKDGSVIGWKWEHDL